MDVTEYQRIVKKTAVYPKDKGIEYCALGLVGEAGEIANKVKKLIRDKPHIMRYMRVESDLRPADIKEEADELERSILKEIGDVVWYCAALSEELGGDLAYVMNQNFDKLIARKERGTLKGSGDDR